MLISYLHIFHLRCKTPVSHGGRISSIPGIVKLCESSDKAGGLSVIINNEDIVRQQCRIYLTPSPAMASGVKTRLG